MAFKFNSHTQNLLLERGKLEDNQSRMFIRKALGLVDVKVEASKHTILSGPPGVGKSYGTMDECIKGNVKYILIAPGTTDIEMTCKIAMGVYNLAIDQELVVILDDSDDVVFGHYDDLNKWKVAMADVNPETGLIPYYHYSKSIVGTLTSLEKAEKFELVDALKSFQSTDSVGISIPMDQVRFVILCNLDLEDPKSYRSSKIRSAVLPVLDRFNYKRMNLTWEHQWGWLAYVLSNSQPFDEYPLKDEQKKELLNWMYSNWDNLRSTSYRTVRKLAAEMINNPDSYIDQWQELLKGH